MAEQPADDRVYRRSSDPSPTQLEQQEQHAAEAARAAGFDVKQTEIPNEIIEDLTE